MRKDVYRMSMKLVDQACRLTNQSAMSVWGGGMASVTAFQAASPAWMGRRHFTPSTLNPRIKALDPKPIIRNPASEIRNPKPRMPRKPEPQTLELGL